MRVAATTLESFRLFLTGDWMTEESLVATIKGEFKSTPQVELGKAYHSVIETPERYRVAKGYMCNGYQFAHETVDPMLAFVDRRGVFEAKAARAFGKVTLVAKADHLLGAHLSEFKTTCGTFDAEKYMDSYQWRVMALLFEPLIVTYRVACLKDHENGVAELRSIEMFNLYPYAGLHADCCELLGRFVEFVERRGLGDFLRARQEAA